MVENVDEIVRKLTPEQTSLLILVADILDVQAGDGLGTANTHVDGQTVWIDELCLRLSEAFGLDEDMPLGEAVRARLNSLEGEGGGD